MAQDLQPALLEFVRVDFMIPQSSDSSDTRRHHKSVLYFSPRLEDSPSDLREKPVD